MLSWVDREDCHGIVTSEMIGLRAGLAKGVHGLSPCIQCCNNCRISWRTSVMSRAPVACAPSQLPPRAQRVLRGQMIRALWFSDSSTQAILRTLATARMASVSALGIFALPPRRWHSSRSVSGVNCRDGAGSRWRRHSPHCARRAAGRCRLPSLFPDCRNLLPNYSSSHSSP